MTHAFDAVAERYDATFTEHRLGRWLREPVRRRLAAAFAPGSRVLELGCGTGDDAVWLAARDVEVVALDASPAMLRVARAKAERAGVLDRITFTEADLAAGAVTLAIDPAAPALDGAFSNFGVLNCLADLHALAGAIAPGIRTGGRLLLVVMGPLCLWEMVGYGARGRLSAAFRRTARPALARLGAAAPPLPVWYHSPRQVRRAVAPWFRPVASVGVGLLLPPTDFSPLVDRWPGLFRVAAAADRRLAANGAAAWLSDHHLSVFERC